MIKINKRLHEMEKNKASQLTRHCSELDLRSCTDNGLGLDNLVFKSPAIDGTPGRKRKRHKTDNDDNLSLQSVDVNIHVQRNWKRKKRFWEGLPSINEENHENKRRSSLSRMPSLSNIFSPVKPMKKVGQALQKSFSLKNLVSPNKNAQASKTPNKNAQASKTPSQGTPYKKKPPGTPPRKRKDTYWYETVGDDKKKKMSITEIERQEAIFELVKCEEDLVRDLQMVKSTYHDSMKKLKLLTDQELEQIFGHIDKLVPIHQEIADDLKDQKLTNGSTDEIGKVLIDWIPCLECYVSYCANQVYAKTLLDTKKQLPAVEDFLQRCQESPFSRKLDLWSFLDVPRSRLVKYPLLFKAIQKKTPADHPDQAYLDQATQKIEEIIGKVDKRTGQAKCEFTQEKIEYLEDGQKCPEIEESKVILCDGVLKNNRGTKLYAFLFEKAFVLTRHATRGQQMRYQVYRQPIPITELVLEDLQDGQGKMGSFRSAFTQGQSAKNMFKASFRDESKGQSHTLQCNDEHDKKQWMQCLQDVLATVPQPPPKEEEGEKSDKEEDKVLSSPTTDNKRSRDQLEGGEDEEPSPKLKRYGSLRAKKNSFPILRKYNSFRTKRKEKKLGLDEDSNKLAKTVTLQSIEKLEDISLPLGKKRGTSFGMSRINLNDSPTPSKKNPIHNTPKVCRLDTNGEDTLLEVKYLPKSICKREAPDGSN